MIIKLVKSIFIATRPKTLIVAIFPVMIGSSLAYKHGLFHNYLLLFTLLSAVFIQIGTNFANDVYDFIKGADNDQRLGPVRAVQARLISIKSMKILTAVAFSFAVLFGLPLILKGGIPILSIGLLSIVSGYAYTAGPYPLGYNGWGDLFVFCFFGPIAVCGTYFLQTELVSYEALILGIIAGCLSVLILCINNLRDIETDKKAGKRTIAVRFGERVVMIWFVILILTSYFLNYYLVFHLSAINSRIFYLLVILTLPLAVIISLNIYKLSGAELNSVFSRVILFITLYSGLLIASIIL